MSTLKLIQYCETLNGRLSESYAGRYAGCLQLCQMLVGARKKIFTIQSFAKASGSFQTRKSSLEVATTTLTNFSSCDRKLHK